MAPVSLATGNTPVQYMVLSGGFQGTDETVSIMSQLAMGVYGSRSPKIADLALKIVRAANVPEKDYAGEMRAIHNWVRDHIRYIRDVHGQETLQPPEHTAFVRRAGDCDDKAVLDAALLSSIGIPTRFKVLGVTPEKYSHVYLQARIGNNWISLDPIMAGGPGQAPKPAGWEAPKAMRAIEKTYPENIPEGITMKRGINGLGYVGDPRIVSFLEPDPGPERAYPGPYVRQQSFLDNDAPIEQLSNNAPAFPQNQNVPRRMSAHLLKSRATLIDKRNKNAAATARAESEEAAYNALQHAAMNPGEGMDGVYTPDQLAAIGTGYDQEQPQANMQVPAMVSSPEGIDVQFGRNALVMNGSRGDRIAYRGLWALNEQPPTMQIPVGMSGFAPGTIGSGRRAMLPGMSGLGYLGSRSLSGPGLADLAEDAAPAPAPAPISPHASSLKTLGLVAIAVGIGMYLCKKK